MPRRLERALSPALKGWAQVSRRQGDVRLIGRVVDCNAGTPRWLNSSGLTIANATWDLKLVDTATGETLAAFHHRGVSGMDAPNLSEKVDHWLRQAAPVDGFVGFAIGRSIWWDALKGFLDGKLERSAAADQIASNYLRFVQVFNEAESGARV